MVSEVTPGEEARIIDVSLPHGPIRCEGFIDRAVQIATLRVCLGEGIRKEEILVTTPDHVENTGDNLRHAAEATHSPEQDDDDGSSPPEQSDEVTPLPDFNT
jgi:hypothetical protein